ncbi:hypothetical protein QNH48_12485 [Neobacillus sp. YX16]|uniref:hypothetical protein n=1 Tax=Neobacillus sp. YX16 TaxID=3047874 RepID=UPI0024C345C3|nr:hypothetical protein [Neobacillus sp. YX16]WHZ05386.1 hypothetical protein QNH48_12485 [Neobacillus sp. YX16]
MCHYVSFFYFNYQSTNEQAKYGREISIEVGNVLEQTDALNMSIETQTHEVEEMVYAIDEGKVQIDKLK